MAPAASSTALRCGAVVRGSYGGKQAGLGRGSELARRQGDACSRACVRARMRAHTHTRPHAVPRPRVKAVHAYQAPMRATAARERT